MTKELEPCPFCPEGVLPVRLKKDEKPTGIVAHACYALGIEIRVPEHVLNTRYKRTCVDRSGKSMLEFLCSKCGYKDGEQGLLIGQHCPGCGAEVVDGD